MESLFVLAKVAHICQLRAVQIWNGIVVTLVPIHKTINRQDEIQKETSRSLFHD